MSTRVPPIERIRAEIDQAFSSERPLGEVMEEVARLGLRLLVQTVIEAEVTEFLGRERYAHGDRARDGHRNGHSPLTVKTTAGSVTIQRPKVRGTGVAFASRLLGKSVTKSNAFESLVIAGFVRGLSMRDIEASISEALGPEATVSKSTVSRICEAIHHEFETWRLRDLSDIELDYLFLDASHFRMHPGSKAEPILAAWGITTEGAPVFIGLSPAGSESDDAWHGFLADLEARGLRSPLLGISDGAPGLTGAFDRAFPTAERQRCLVHRCRNLVAKVSKKDQQQVKADFWSIFDDIDAPPGKKAIAVAEGRRKEFELRWKATYPAAVACLGRLRAPDHPPSVPDRPPQADSPLELHRAHLRRDPPAGEGDRQAPRRAKLRVACLRRARPGKPWVARGHDDRRRHQAPPGSQTRDLRTATPATLDRRP